ncbi:MAG TPA: hypothetical protein VFB72_11600, partial [Verrucomicrobiae bacterium]|nr:hypothetical protein [Verrucomicrobiae bacterium]
GLAQSFQSLNAIMVEGRRFDAGREVVERELKCSPLMFDADSPSHLNLPFRFYASREFEPLRDRNQKIAGAILRCQEGIEGLMQISAEPVGARSFKISASIENHTQLGEIESQDYDAVLLRSLVSLRISMRSKGAEFISSPAYAMA